MKIALAQLDVKAGRPKLNVKRMLEMIEEAKREGAELIAFPEMAVGGYLVGDKWTDKRYCENLMRYNHQLAEAADGIIVIYGNVYFNKGMNNIKGYDGREMKFNSAYVCADKEIVKIIHKTNLPNYRIFDDKRYFMSGKLYHHKNGAETVRVGRHKIGIEICEDMWLEDYNYNITEQLIDDGAEFIVNISCSPWTYNKDKARDGVIHRLKDNILHDDFVPFYYVNAVGVQNNGKNIVTFDGDSRAYDREGTKLYNSLGAYEEGILYFINGYTEGKEVRQDREIPKILSFEAWKEDRYGNKYHKHDFQKNLTVYKCSECGKEKAVMEDERGNKEKISIWKAKQYLGLV